MKKLIAIMILSGLIGMNFSMPVGAKTFRKSNIKVIQSQVNEYKFNNVNLDWWKNYNDEYLEGYIVKAISDNQDLRVATLRVEEAKQNVKLQFSKELPQASVGFADYQVKLPDDIGQIMGASRSENFLGIPMIASYEADIFLKNHDKTKSMKKMHEISKYQERAAYITVASAIGATYFNIVRLDKLISIQQEIITNRKQIYELMKSRNKIGVTSTADLVRADKSYILATADMVDLKKAREILLNSLAVLTGDSPNNIGEYKRVSYDKIMYKGVIPKEISSEVIMQRPDYLVAEKMVEKAGIDVRVARKEFLPSINIMGLLFFNSSSLNSSMNWANAIAQIGGQAMLPIFTGGAKVANLRLKKNKYEQVMQDYYKTNLVSIQEVNDSMSNLKLDEEKYQKNLQSYKMQKDDYKYMENRFNQGVISGLDLIQQKEALLVIDKMIVASKTDCYIDQISLYKAVGGKL